VVKRQRDQVKGPLGHPTIYKHPTIGVVLLLPAILSPTAGHAEPNSSYSKRKERIKKDIPGVQGSVSSQRVGIQQAQ
jgi:hypothetical protein